MTLRSMTLTDFVAELASSSPAPGGGSIAALGGALAAGLASMVGELTVGREKYADVQDEMTRVKDEAKKVAAELLELIDRDTDAFNAYMAALKLPKGTDEEKAARREAMQQAAKGSVEVPLRTLELCAAAARLALSAIRHGNANAVTDAASAGQFARAAAMSAAYNVRINLLSIKDEVYVTERRLAVADLLGSVESDMGSISETIEKALA